MRRKEKKWSIERRKKNENKKKKIKKESEREMGNIKECRKDREIEKNDIGIEECEEKRDKEKNIEIKMEGDGVLIGLIIKGRKKNFKGKIDKIGKEWIFE